MNEYVIVTCYGYAWRLTPKRWEKLKAVDAREEAWNLDDYGTYLGAVKDVTDGIKDWDRA